MQVNFEHDLLLAKVRKGLTAWDIAAEKVERDFRDTAILV